MRIGELSKLTGVSTRTIRYYEELGVLPPPERSDGGSRRYPPEYKFYVEGARLLKDMGLSLEEIRLVGWWCLGRRLPPGQEEEVRTFLDKEARILEHKIRILSEIRNQLEKARKDTGIRMPGDEMIREINQLNSGMASIKGGGSRSRRRPSSERRDRGQQPRRAS